jgi:flavin reductase (DIM6/NTAB) family NADH-FMN oxidoreductase RutF
MGSVTIEKGLRFFVDPSPAIYRNTARVLKQMVSAHILSEYKRLLFADTISFDSFMPRKSLPLEEVYGLLEPGPVVLLTTAGSERPNIMTMSWHTMMEFEPPLVGCVISDRNYSFGLLDASGECVINIPTVEMSETVVGCGNTSGADTHKFTTFHLTPVPAALVGAPLIAECHANLECRVVDRQMVASYSLFVLEVVKAWIDPAVKHPRTLHHRGYGNFMVAGETIKLRSKMK